MAEARAPSGMEMIEMPMSHKMRLPIAIEQMAVPGPYCVASCLPMMMTDNPRDALWMEASWKKFWLSNARIGCDLTVNPIFTSLYVCIINCLISIYLLSI